MDSEEDSGVLIGGSGADRSGHLCGGDHIGGIRSGGGPSIGCRGP